MTVSADRTHRLPSLVWFLAVLAVLSLAYTQMALDMEWRTEAGRIGAGFFPRIIGVLTFAGCVVGIALNLRGSRPAGEPDEGQGGGQHTRMLLFTIAAMVGFLMLLVPLGAILASALFLGLLLAVLNRHGHTTNIALSLLLPVGLYLLFQSWLNAGLPSGVLPPL